MGQDAFFNLVLADMKHPHRLHCVVVRINSEQELHVDNLLFVIEASQKIFLPFAISPTESVTVSERPLSFLRTSLLSLS